MTDGAHSEVLRPILLRSSTPASNEKVLNWVEGIHREGDADPPQSVLDPEDDYKSQPPRQNGVYSPRPKSHNSEALRDLANSPVSYGGGGQRDVDHDSNVQNQSEPDNDPLPIREPGPHDPPGPHYESYDSGPSFGNMGPLPTDDQGYTQPYGYANTWGEWNKPAAPWNLDAGGYGKSPSQASKTPNGNGVASPRPGSVNINVESPTNTQIASKASQQARSMASDVKSQQAVSPPNAKAASRITSPQLMSPTSSSTPLSPLAKSHITGKSHPTEKGTGYPPLPASRFGEEDNYSGGAGGYETPVSPTRTHPPAPKSKAYSVAPSDSLSHVGIKKQQQARAAAQQRGDNRSAAPGSVLSGGHQTRPFSPYRHAPTNEDLMHAAARNRAMIIPEESSRAPSHRSKTPSAVAPPLPLSPPTSPKAKPIKAPSHISTKQPSVAPSAVRTAVTNARRDANATPTPAHPGYPDEQELNAEEQRLVRDALTRTTPRTSHYSPSVVGTEVLNSHFHDGELCALFKELDNTQGSEAVKKAVRKAVRQRVKKLGMKHDEGSILEYQRQHTHAPIGMGEEQPQWAADIKREIVLMQQRIESLGPKIENLRQIGSASGGEADRYYEEEDVSHTPVTQSVNIHTQPTGTLAGSIYAPPQTEMIADDDDLNFESATARQGVARSYTAISGTGLARDDSPGQMYLEEELYKLRQRKPHGSHSGSHNTWEVARDGDPEDDEPAEDYDEALLEHDDDDEPVPITAPTIPGSEGGDQRSLPPVPVEDERSVVASNHWGLNANNSFGEAEPELSPWLKIHQRLLTWAITWPMSTIDMALNSTTRGNQVDEVALTIWSTQTYKRYVRSRLTDRPQGVVDRLFVPPNVADAINSAVYHGRHGDACGMLRDLWAPFGLEGMPRLLIVLAKHRNDDNHWVVHRFCLPEGALTTYDSYPERTLPDGRPLGWWFAIRIAWPNATYPSPDHLMQKMVRLHRPMQLPIDNSVSATGIWRNLLMASRAERSLDLERLRDMINTEVKNLRQRKLMGKLSISPPRPAWQDLN